MSSGDQIEILLILMELLSISRIQISNRTAVSTVSSHEPTQIGKSCVVNFHLGMVAPHHSTLNLYFNPFKS